MIHMLEVSLYCTGKTPHLSMLVTGFLILQEQGKISLSWEIDEKNRKRFPYLPLLGVYAEGKRILFDMADGYGMSPKELAQAVEQSDYYFRRSFSKTYNQKLDAKLQEKMHPLGFHYHVSYPGNFIDRAESFSDWRKEWFQLVFNGASRRYFTPKRFECEPQKKKHLSVMFYTRLWNPGDMPKLYDSVVKINQDRIRLVSELKKNYGSCFCGGIQYSGLAAKSCKDLIADIGTTKRKKYLELMHQADICIGSAGLHGSIGWKTGEYIAAAKAVVNEKFQYEVTGDFCEGINYLPFMNTDQCLKHVEWLMKHPEQVYLMKQANQEYYQNYLRPDRLVANALKQVFPDFEKEKEIQWKSA